MRRRTGTHGILGYRGLTSPVARCSIDAPNMVVTSIDQLPARRSGLADSHALELDRSVRSDCLTQHHLHLGRPAVSTARASVQAGPGGGPENRRRERRASRARRAGAPALAAAASARTPCQDGCRADAHDAPGWCRPPRGALPRACSSVSSSSAAAAAAAGAAAAAQVQQRGQQRSPQQRARHAPDPTRPTAATRRQPEDMEAACNAVADPA
ncbi:MAG: hypothetical protein WDW36_008296 [Sanguina aurantia]